MAKLATIALVLVLATFLGGCSNQTTTTPTAVPTTEPTNAPAPTPAEVANPPTSAPAPTATAVVLKNVTAANLLSVADLPAGYSVVTVGQLMNPGPGSVLADPSSYTACGAGPEESLDIGFGVDQLKGPFIGETLKASPSVDAADKAMSDAASRVQSCTKTGEGLGIASVSVSAQSIPEDLGDAVTAFKVILNQETGPAAVGYVMLIRQTNVIVTIFYTSSTGQDDIDQLLTVARTAVTKVD